MTRVIAVANQKGGVGKTTTCVNLAASLEATKRRVLVVDMDPQANATNGIGLNGSNGTGGIYDAIGQTKAPSDVVQDTAVAGLKLIAATPALAGAELELADVPCRESRLDSTPPAPLPDLWQNAPGLPTMGEVLPAQPASHAP